MNLYFIPAALIVALILIFLLSVILKRPLKGFGFLFVLLFLFTWGAQIWIAPVGPITFGIAWIPLVFVCLILILLILSFSDNRPRSRDEKAEGPVIVAGFFFWLILVLLILAIGLGYYNRPTIIAMLGSAYLFLF